MSDDIGLTGGEQAVLESLADAWNTFVKLPVMHADHVDEFRRHVHELQRLIAVRVARRFEPDHWS